MVERDHKQIFHEAISDDVEWVNATFTPSSVGNASDEKEVKQAFMDHLGKTKMQVEPLMRALGVVGKAGSGKRYSLFKFADSDIMKPMRIKSD